jgi:hypothetical protein
MTVVAGLRRRLVHDSVRSLVVEGLGTLGWFDPGRAHRPVNVADKPPHWSTPIAPNTVAVDFVGSDPYEAEVGSRLISDVIVCYVDIYAQDDSFGLHIANDVRDWLRGRLQVRAGVNYPIYDYRQPTPAVLGYMDIRNVRALRNVAVNTDMWVRHWFRVRCEITDTYASSGQNTPYPAPDLYPAGVLYPST